MRTVLHVGAHKTATSLIQKYFRDEVAPAANLPIAVVGRSDTNQLIGWGQHLEQRPDRLRERLEGELHTKQYVLVSHENTLGRPFDPEVSGLYPHADRLSKALLDISDPFDPLVVFYIRPLADFVESFYLQTVHQGSTSSFEEWFATIDHTGLSWTSVVEALEKSFGSDRVVVGDFREISEGQDSYLSSFFRLTGLPTPGKVRYRPVRNASVSVAGLELALRMNAFLETKEQRRAARTFLQTHFSNLSGERARPMPPDVRDMLTRQDAAGYEALAQRSR